MHISKLLPAICAVAVCSGLISVHAQDNPAQAAARAALLAKMNELDAPNAQPPAVIVTPAGATLEKPAVPTIQTPPPAPTVPEPQTAPTDNQAGMKATADQATAKADAQKAAQVKKGTAMAEKKRAAAEAAALAQAKAKAQPAPTTQKAPAKTGNLGLTPIEAPPLPISAAKQQQLQALLVKYQADQISSAEYQTQRAAILSQP
jgi:type IV secretory pathway VirB10-like protein